jgi:hypothetical protein
LTREVRAAGYRFLPGIAAFSSGVAALPGFEIVHARMAVPLPWREGFARIDRHLNDLGRPRTALCGIMLRSPAPYTFDGFDGFNQGYRALLADWGILLDGDNPIPRTNVAPVVDAPREPSLYAFDYTVAGTTPSPTFVVAGAGELRERARGADGIVRRGETSPEAMREKARFVLEIMQARLRALDGAWDRVTVIDVYTAHPIHGIVEEEILRAAGPAAVHGVHWYPSRPPLQGLEFEMDLRGVARELVLAS